MTKKDIWLSVVLVALVAAYICFFTNLFKHKAIRIFYTTNQARAVRVRKDVPYVMFGLEGKFNLTEIKVVPVASFQNNSETPPVWHLISDSNSLPVQRFVYGQNIRGMKPAISGAQAQDLQTNVMYRLLVTARGIKGSEDFEIKPSEN
jgi:hypothetical protein